MAPDPAAATASAAPPAAAGAVSGLSIATLPARIGVLRLLAGPLGLQAGLPPEVAGAYVARQVTPRAFQTSVDEILGTAESLAQAGTVSSLGAAPLIVLSRGRDLDPAWQRRQTDLLRLSSESQQLIAAESGHNIQLDQPEAAIGAIAQLVERTRRPSTR